MSLANFSLWNSAKIDKQPLFIEDFLDKLDKCILPKDIVKMLISFFHRNTYFYPWTRVGFEADWTMIPKKLYYPQACEIMQGICKASFQPIYSERHLEMAKYVIPYLDPWDEKIDKLFYVYDTSRYFANYDELLELLLDKLPFSYCQPVIPYYSATVCRMVKKLLDENRLNVTKTSWPSILDMACVQGDLRLFHLSLASVEHKFEAIKYTLQQVTKDNLSTKIMMLEILCEQPDFQLPNSEDEPQDYIYYILGTYGLPISENSQISETLLSVLKLHYHEVWEESLDNLLCNILFVSDPSHVFVDPYPYDESIANELINLGADIHQVCFNILRCRNNYIDILDRIIDLGCDPRDCLHFHPYQQLSQEESRIRLSDYLNIYMTSMSYDQRFRKR